MRKTGCPMDFQDAEAPLVVVDELKKISVVNHTRDVHILISAFLLVFLAYGAAQNLETTVNDAGNLGAISLGILYLSFTLFSVVASPVVRSLGSKNAPVLGTSGYWLFIAANLIPSWYTMIPASLYSEGKFDIDLVKLFVGLRVLCFCLFV